ncbi:MAG: DUF2071 domain-containing protein [Opitutales bacterium]|nr:DUF2071 domain-containing protein [Opitutales bacterium]
MKAASLQDELTRAESSDEPAVMSQRWSELLFLHWAVAPEAVQPRLPPGLKVDTFDGRAWIGIVPFRMDRIRPFGLPAVPGLSAFPELNLRTYVSDGMRRHGVWFFSLDAGGWLGVRIARYFFHLPYHHAWMRVREDTDRRIHFTCKRRRSGPALAYTWKPHPGEYRAETATLTHFLVERYRLYTYDRRRNRLLTGRVSHPPYLLGKADVDFCDTRLFTLNGFDAPDRPPDHIIASSGTEVRVQALTPAD